MSAIRIDVHSHLAPRRIFDRLPDGIELAEGPAITIEGRGTGRVPPAAMLDIDLHRAIQQERGVDLTVIGPWMELVRAPFDPEVQHRWCHVMNEELAASVDGTGHSLYLAALPDLDAGRAAEELEWALEHGAAGGMLAASAGTGTLAQPSLDRLWETTTRLGAALVVHPGNFQPAPLLAAHGAASLVGNLLETTLAALSLIAVGVPDRYPDLRLLLVHGGGYFPYQFGRIDAGLTRTEGLGVQRRPPADYLRWFNYDTVLFADEPTRYMLDIVGPDRVMAGSDSPFHMNDHRPYEHTASLGLADAEAKRVLGGNAVDFFGLQL